MIKTIPTTYNGVEYRSRLEARWAVFFDELGIRHYYEYEGFDLDGRWYVPDFYLPDVRGGMYCEVKPLKQGEDTAIAQLPSATGKICALLMGPPQGCLFDRSANEWDERHWIFFPIDHEPGWSVSFDSYHEFCLCPVTGRTGFEFEGQRRWGRIASLGESYELERRYADKSNKLGQRIDEAAQKSQKYRFH